MTSPVTSISTALEVVVAGCELSVTVSVQESRKRASGVPANMRVAGAKPIPEGNAPPAQVKEYVYGSTPPEAAGSASLSKVPTVRLTSLGSGGSVSGVTPPVTSISTALEAVAAGCELSVTVSVQESRKRASGVPANMRVAGAKPIPEGSAPPAQVKEYVYGCDAARSSRERLAVEGSNSKTYLARERKGEADKGRRRTNRKPEDIRNAPRWPKTGFGFGHAEGAEEGLAGINRGGSARKDSLVREESHPVRTAVDTRFVGTNPAGDTKWKPMLNGFLGKKIEIERLAPPGKVDRKTGTAAGGERKGKANVDDSPDVVHWSNPSQGKW